MTVNPLGVPSSARADLPRESGGFRLLGELGSGGMGRVYLAEDLSSGRQVAVKVISEEFATSAEGLSRFRREARTAAALSHPRCVFVFGAGEIDGRPAIAMELCEGRTLQDELDRGEPIPIQTALAWMGDVLEGLAAAHRAGIVHRDVKPSNCFLTADGRVKVGDFGLARALETDVRLTQSGTFLGSPLYASPEQARAGEVDARSDVYSCAATLFALLTGKPPFSGRNTADVLARIATEKSPSARRLRNEVHADLDRLLRKSMSRDPGKRPADAQELLFAMRELPTARAVAGPVPLRLAALVFDQQVIGWVARNCLVIPIFGREEFNRAPWDTTWVLREIAANWLVLSLLEGLLGAGLGKWLCGLRVVRTRDLSKHLGAAALRGFVFVIPITIAWILLLPGGMLIGLGLPAEAVMILGTLLLAVSARPANGWRGLHEFASGTRVIRAPFPFQARWQTRKANRASGSTETKSIAEGESLAPTAAMTAASAAAYTLRGEVARTPLASVLVGWDSNLDREVWIVRRPNDVTHGVRSAKAFRELHWLQDIEWEGGRAEVYEAPGGDSLESSCTSARGTQVSDLCRWLAALAAELDSSSTGSSPSVDIEHLWVDRHGELRILPFPLAHVTQPPPSGLDALQSVAERIHARPPPLSVYGSTPSTDVVLLRLRGKAEPFQSLAEARSALENAALRPEVVPRGHRFAQLATGPLLASVLLSLIMGLRVVLDPKATTAWAADQALEDIAWDRGLEVEFIDRDSPLTPDGRRAREILLASDLSPRAVGSGAIAAADSREPLWTELASSRPPPSEGEIMWAWSILESENRMTRGLGVLSNVYWWRHSGVVGLVLLTQFLGFLLWGIVTFLGTLTRAGGFSLALFGLVVRRRDGARAAWPRRLTRTLVQWVPLALLAFGGFFLTTLGAPIWASVVMISVLAVLSIAGCIAPLFNPILSVPDLVAGTRLMQR